MNLLTDIAVKPNNKVITGCFNITDEERVRRFVWRVEKELSKVDILVNNAGIHPLKPIEEIDSEEWDLVFRVNVKAHFFFVKQCYLKCEKENLEELLISLLKLEKMAVLLRPCIMRLLKERYWLLQEI